MGGAARRCAGGLGGGGGERDGDDRPDGGQDAARVALGSAAGVPPPHQEPARRRRDQDAGAAHPGEAAGRARHLGHGGAMTLHLYNTMSRAVERFEPIAPGRVSLYTCGPTVYNFAHIGNFRTFLFEDLLRRWLVASGYDVFHVMNITDVDDKTINGAKQAGKPLREYVGHYIDAFHED